MSKSLRVRRIDHDSDCVLDEIATLRREAATCHAALDPEVSARIESVFGAPLDVTSLVDRVCEQVQQRGRDAVLELTRRLKGYDVTPERMRVTAEELADAHGKTDPILLHVLRRHRRQLRTFQAGILHRSATLPMGDHELQLLYRPIGRIGVCIPSGPRAITSLLMSVVPAQAAGVRQIAVLAPQAASGIDADELLGVCRELGLTEVYRVGGIQGVAALARGVEDMPAVDMIVGAGTTLVEAAKNRLSKRIGTDLPNAPSEIAIIADDSANPHYVAADLLCQVEQNQGIALLVTPNEGFAESVEEYLARQCEKWEASTTEEALIEQRVAIVVVPKLEDACKLTNGVAPERLLIATADPEALLPKIESAGSVLLGQYTPTAVGDYAAGPSSFLPTAGLARHASGLSANDFLKQISVVRYSLDRLRSTADDLQVMTSRDSRPAAQQSVEIRLRPAETLDLREEDLVAESTESTKSPTRPPTK
ncbi:Histidinol dehydrogenase [Planctomycetes bacterium Pan216]|uniref:Histidinol dehydrogenase n=1 Tax=Kolteria novifilia TaxID=2527975 RepID=A0A518B5V2_9BACT|nr:Histidinol dehydrogenase [Planctomycetes bacterium Pan216]